MSEQVYYVVDYGTKTGPFSEVEIKERFDLKKEFSPNAKVKEGEEGRTQTIKSFLGYDNEIIFDENGGDVTEKTLNDYKESVNNGLHFIFIGMLLCFAVIGMGLILPAGVATPFLVFPLTIGSVSLIFAGAYRLARHESEARRSMQHDQLMQAISALELKK